MATAPANERTRIAREMHDVLAHRMSLVPCTPGRWSYRADLTPRGGRAAPPGSSSDSAHQRAAATCARCSACCATGRRLDATDRAAAAHPRRPDRPGRRRARRAGMPVRLRLPADALDDRLPARSIGRSAYRIVQEGLTNARKHAPARRGGRRARRRPRATALTVEVRNPCPVGRRGRTATRRRHRADRAGRAGRRSPADASSTGRPRR